LNAFSDATALSSNDASLSRCWMLKATPESMTGRVGTREYKIVSMTSSVPQDFSSQVIGLMLDLED
jgi:hypothetical protein